MYIDKISFCTIYIIMRIKNLELVAILYVLACFDLFVITYSLFIVNIIITKINKCYQYFPRLGVRQWNNYINANRLLAVYKKLNKIGACNILAGTNGGGSDESVI